MICPVCNKEVNDGEFLVVGHDLIGSLIVRHLIPIESAKWGHVGEPLAVSVSDSNLTDSCGEAGFTEVSFTHKDGGRDERRGFRTGF